MAPDTTRLGSDLIVASLQRELAEARAERDKWRAEFRDYFHNEDAVIFIVSTELFKAACPEEMPPEAPGPSDAKGEGAASSTPAEPAQKLVPLPEGAVPVVRCTVTDADFHNPNSRPLMAMGFYKALDPALYGVPAERVRELEAAAELRRQTNEALNAEAERLRKAIEEHRHTYTGMECEHRSGDRKLWSALTPPPTAELAGSPHHSSTDSLGEDALSVAAAKRGSPANSVTAGETASVQSPTAASGEPAMECLDKIGEAMTASAPTAEGGCAMTKAMHTPGPWERFPFPGHGLEVWTEGDGPRDSGLPSAKPICEVLTTAADANLIAAAPDLLEALTDLLCFASPGGVHGEEPEGWSDQAKRFCGAARAAIAKAKGSAV